ncbi:DUF3883 domain-containing protein [Microbacterium sp.]|uniref:DUF3883 domain-containing protein n=1 Tax=Microbacterium sp. TaxID=51671 RepID=UPI003C7632C6
MPTDFQVTAALWVARAIDPIGTDQPTLERTFHHAVTQGRFPRQDLDNAYRFLLDAGLILPQVGRASLHESVVPLLALPDDTALPLLARLLGDAPGLEDDFADAVRRAEIGALGENAVVRWCVEELVEVGRRDLAEQVKRVSLVSDRFGYDITAPTVRADPRMLEVKASTSGSGKTFRFFLTRNEYEVGRRHPRQWALVACAVAADSVTILGWCRVSEFERYLPDDGNGHWTEARVYLPVSALLSGVPSAVD